MKNISIIIILTLLTMSCKTESKQNSIPEKTSEGLLISFDTENDTKPHYERNIKNTTTPNGWKIKYLVKNDSTRHRDLYIEWSKGNIRRNYCGHYLLELQPYFTPVFKTETDDYIFMEFEVRGGDGILILPKNNKTSEVSFSYVIGYSPKYAQVVYIPESSYSTDHLDVEAYDIKSGKAKSVRFSHPCSVIPENECLTEARFDGNHIQILANPNGDRNATETKTISF